MGFGYLYRGNLFSLNEPCKLTGTKKANLFRIHSYSTSGDCVKKPKPPGWAGIFEDPQL
jgi:hypothetical protein